METLDYIVLEYAESDMNEVGAPFVILLRTDNHDQLAFRVYVLASWRDLLSPTNTWDREHLDDFIYELKKLPFEDAEGVGQFFDSVKRLGVGALRTAASGVTFSSGVERRRLGIDSPMKDVLLCERQQFSAILATLPQISRYGIPPQ